MSSIKAIVGLGNPGAQYAGTRHNIGFDVVDLIAGNNTWRDKGGALVVEHRFEGEKVLLIKPMTFMNRSGEPLQSLLGFYKIELDQVAVVHDEIDLPLGSLRIRKGGGAGGHRGIESVIQCCGGPDFIRFRIGVGRPLIPSIDISDWVLGKFSQEERKAVDGVVKRASQGLEILVKDGILKAQQAFNS
jgi:PTH1 family peptidyl-tRNA hydrolase